MKALSCEVILTGASTRVDGSLSIRLSTPELSTPEKAAIFDLAGQNCKMLLQPMGQEPDELVMVNKEIGSKTPSERMRGVLFVLYRQQQEAGKMAGKPFDLFYIETMNKYIEDIKRQLEPEDYRA